MPRIAYNERTMNLIIYAQSWCVAAYNKNEKVCFGSSWFVGPAERLR